MAWSSPPSTAATAAAPPTAEPTRRTSATEAAAAASHAAVGGGADITAAPDAIQAPWPARRSLLCAPAEPLTAGSTLAPATLIPVTHGLVAV